MSAKKAVAIQEEVTYLGSSSLDKDIELIETRDSDTASIEKQAAPIRPPSTAREIATEILTVEDDPTLNPWTLRMWIIGLGLSFFSGTITTINSFKPQSVHIDVVFVAIISYIMGRFLAVVLPKKGRIGAILNPGPFNKKEHSAICIMVAASASTPEAMSVLAVQKLYYNTRVTPIIGILLLLSTQLLGYGISGILRKSLVYPSIMLYPTAIPTASLLENLHRMDRRSSRKRMKVFYIAFGCLFIWQAFPQYIMPVLAGVSVFCLSMRNDMFVTHLFGGVMANEGLGVGSISLDWSAVGGHGNPLWMPLQTLMNSFGGYLIGIFLYMALYYSNTWNAKSLPFLSPQMFSHKSTSKKYITYNQTAILDHRFHVQESLLEKQGLPWLSSSYALGMTVMNMAIMAAITHMFIWHWPEMKSAFEHVNLASLKKALNPRSWDLKFWKHKAPKISLEEADRIDPHYKLMQAYEDVPSWWFTAIWFVAAIVGFIASQVSGSNLEWWGFIVAILLAVVLIPPFAALTAMTGFYMNVEPLIQMIGAFMLPGRPIANLYFSLFGYNSMRMAKNLLKDLKLGQYVHLSPKCTCTMQFVGTVIGCIMSYTMMEEITTDKRDILLAIQGTNVWSGQMLQSRNSQAVTWGGLASKMYGIGARYQWVSLGFLLGIFVPIPFWLAHKYIPGAQKLRLDYLNMAIILGGIGQLDRGTHASATMHYAVGFFSQFWLRKYKTKWFVKYNYILSAGLDGGTQVMNFLLTFAVLGASGRVIDMPKYWGNHWQRGNFDYCKADPALHERGKPKTGGGGGGDD